MFTNSGLRVFPETGIAPSLTDIGLSLGRVPRFGGHTTAWWPVLLHSIVVHEMMHQIHPTREFELLALLHDAHESVTGDVPTPWKTDDIRQHQRDLDLRIRSAFGLPLTPDWPHDERLAECDLRALYAEAVCLGPPGLQEFFGIDEPHHADCFLVRAVHRRWGRPQDTDGHDSPGVLEYCQRINHLLSLPPNSMVNMRWM